MKILVFVESFMSPTLTFVYNEVVELAKHHHVTILCLERLNEDNFPFNNVVVIPLQETLIQRKISWHFEKTNISMSRQNKKFRNNVTKFIDNYKPDVIHCHFGYESIKLLDNIERLSIPVFISFHGYDASQMLRRKCYVGKLNSYFKNKNIVPICVSDFVKSNLLKAKVNAQNAELLLYGIDINFFNPVCKEKATNRKFTFLQISSFLEKKGHTYTLRAFKLFLNSIEDKKKYKLILAGGWGLFEQIQTEVASLGLLDYVEFTGIVTHDEAKHLLSQADVFLHHSITASNGDTEGMPNAIIEAMAMGLPILSTFHAGIPELVEDGVNGYLVEEKDVAAYAKRMKDILSWGFQAKNREKVVSFFSNQVHYQSLIKIYEKHIRLHTINILHLFNSYPGSNTTNWLYNLISNTPLCKVTIAAEQYTKHNFYSTEFTYIDNPIDSITTYKKNIATWGTKIYDKIICRITEILFGGYSKYIDVELQKNHIDIAHAHFADLACAYVDFIKEKKIPFVVSFYGYDYEYLPHIKPIYIEKYKKLFLKADKFICEGTHGAAILLKMGCAKQKIEIVRLGVETDKIAFKPKSKTSNSLSLIQIASFREKKGHIYTIKAFHHALVACPNMHLTLVGSGDDTIQLQLLEYSSENRLENKVSIFKEIDFSKLHEYIAQFDVFIHPSCYSKNKDCEGGAPIVLLDAQACGLPIISTTHCDIPDEVIHLKTGLLSPEKDINGLTESIKYFYNMPQEEYRKYSEAARAHIEENYSIKKNAIRLKEVYDTVIHA